MTSIAFLEPTLSLVHIPLPVLPNFLHAILTSIRDGPEFYNLTATPQGLSVILPSAIAQSCFAHTARHVRAELGVRLVDNYLAMQVDGEGISDGSRLLQLTRPLAKAGVSILFVTTYFSDYILVSRSDEAKVRQVLLSKDYVFEDLSGSFVSKPASRVNTPMTNLSPIASPRLERDGLDLDSTTARQLDFGDALPTIDSLRDSDVAIRLYTDDPVVMVGCKLDLQELVPAMTELLLARGGLPSFLSLTAAPDTPVSLLLPQSTARHGGGFLPRESLLGGGGNETLIPLSLDLTSLQDGGLAGCGIVCSVIQQLVRAGGDDNLAMSYLSTVVTGNVLILDHDLDLLDADTLSWVTIVGSARAAGSSGGV